MVGLVLSLLLLAGTKQAFSSVIDVNVNQCTKKNRVFFCPIRNSSVTKCNINEMITM